MMIIGRNQTLFYAISKALDLQLPLVFPGDGKVESSRNPGVSPASCCKIRETA